MTVRVSSRGASRLPEMLVPPPNGITTASASSAARRTSATSASVAGAHDDVGDAAEVAAALADEVAQALAAGVDHAVVGVVGDVRLADRALERGAQVAGQLRLGDVELGEGERARGRLARRRSRGASWMNGAKLRLVVVA